MANLTLIPKDTVVFAGDSTVLRCSGTDLIWRHYPLNYKSNLHNDKEVYMDGNLTEEYARKGFRIGEDQTKGEVNLLIENVTVEMAGRYECREGFDDPKSVQLIVLGKVL